MNNSNKYAIKEISPIGRNDESLENEPIEIDFDAMSEGCMSNMSFTMVLIIIFVLAVICNE